MCIICYVGFFSSGVATIGWIGTELIPLEVRALGTMLNTVTCWSTNIMYVIFLVPEMNLD